MQLFLAKAAAVTITGLSLWSTGLSADAAQTSSSAKPTTSCSEWQAVGNSTVSARTCITVKAGKKVSQARGSVQVKNTGTANANVKASWTVSRVAKGEDAASERTVTLQRTVPANGHTYKLGATSAYRSLDASGLGEVQAKIVVVAAKTGTDSIEEEASDDL